MEYHIYSLQIWLNVPRIISFPWRANSRPRSNASRIGISLCNLEMNSIGGFYTRLEDIPCFAESSAACDSKDEIEKSTPANPRQIWMPYSRHTLFSCTPVSFTAKKIDSTSYAHGISEYGYPTWTFRVTKLGVFHRSNLGPVPQKRSTPSPGGARQHPPPRKHRKLTQRYILISVVWNC